MKNENTIFWIIGIVIVVVLILPKLQLTTEPEEFVSIKAHYYDKYGNEVFPLIQDSTTTAPQTQTEIEIPIEEKEGFNLIDSIKDFINDMLSVVRVGPFATVDYDGQCSPSSCPSGYSEVEKYCDSTYNVCFRVCEKYIAGGCGSYGSWSSTSPWTYAVGVGDDNIWKRSVSKSTYTSSCYQFYGKATLSVTDWDPGGLFHSAAQSREVDVKTDLGGSTGACSSSAQTSTQTLGRGDGTTYRAEGKFIPYTAGSCGGSIAYGIEGTLKVYLYYRTASWTSGHYDEEERSCQYECDRDSECGSDGYTGSKYCQGGDVYQNYRTYDCYDYECTDSVSAKKVEDCGTLGCSGGVCLTCTPKTCSVLGKECGSWPDGCGGTVTCPTCPTGYTCDVNGQCIEDIVDISFEVTATNIGDIDFTDLTITDATPIEFENALDLTDIRDLPKDSSQTWYSNKITIKPEWGPSTVFEVCMEGTYIAGTKTQCNSISGVII